MTSHAEYYNDEHVCVHHRRIEARKHLSNNSHEAENVLYLVQDSIEEEAIELVALRRAGWKVHLLRNTKTSPWDITPPWLLGKVMVVDEPNFSVLSVVKAVMRFKPVLVLADQTTTVEVMQRATREYGWPGCQKDARCRRAIGVLRCSLPNVGKHWESTLTKRGMQHLARAVGVLVPFSKPVRADRPVNDQVAMEVRRHGSVVLKGRNDGGVVVCHRGATTAQPINCSSGGRSGKPASLEQFVTGITTVYVAACVDGEVLGGFSLVKQVTLCRTCPSQLVRTFNDPTAAAGMRRLAATLGYTGIFAADFITNASGSSFLIDFNPRVSNFAAVDAEAAGLPRSLHRLLFDAVTRGRYPTRSQREALLPHSALFSKYHMGVLATGEAMWPPWLCSDLFLDVPWRDLWSLRYHMQDSGE